LSLWFPSWTGGVAAAFGLTGWLRCLGLSILEGTYRSCMFSLCVPNFPGVCSCLWYLTHSTTPPEAGTPPVQEGNCCLVPLLDRRGGSRFGLTGWLKWWGLFILNCTKCRVVVALRPKLSRCLFLFVVPNPLNHPARSGHPSCPGGELSLGSPPGQEGWQPLWADGVVEGMGVVHFELYEVSRLRRFASQTFAVSVLVCGA